MIFLSIKIKFWPVWFISGKIILYDKLSKKILYKKSIYDMPYSIRTITLLHYKIYGFRCH